MLSYLLYPATVNRHLSGAHLSAVFSSFGPQKPTQEIYQRILAEISNGENDHVEYKVFVDPKNAKEREIIKTTVAFANTLGGRIYVGVEDDGTLQGETSLCAAYHTNPEKARAALVSHFQALIVENVKPVPNLKIDVFEIKQQPVLVISVEAGNRKPYSNKSHEIWIRKGSSDMVPDPQTEFPMESKSGFDFPRFES
jgi:predicted HTH transcriptional regulator